MGALFQNRHLCTQLMHIVMRESWGGYRIAGNFRGLRFRGSVTIRENINHKNINPGIPGVYDMESH